MIGMILCNRGERKKIFTSSIVYTRVYFNHKTFCSIVELVSNLLLPMGWFFIFITCWMQQTWDMVNICAWHAKWCMHKEPHWSRLMCLSTLKIGTSHVPSTKVAHTLRIPNIIRVVINALPQQHTMCKKTRKTFNNKTVMYVYTI